MGKPILHNYTGSTQAGMTKQNPLVFDHETTTKWMRYFMREGYKRIKARNDSFSLVATLYGPPPWGTVQKIVRGRDLDQNEKYDVARYMISFVKFMREKEGLPINYISLHNEGGIEEMGRWPADGTDGEAYLGHDYNCIWPVEQVVDFISFMGPMLKDYGLEQVGMANGECTRLAGTTKYVEGIVNSEQALQNYSLLTSHGFGSDEGAFTSEPLDIIRKIVPDFHGWITSASWGKMDIQFLSTIYKHIYISKVNGYIPWAVVQRHSQWVGGDPNPGTAILIDDDGNWSIQRGYYWYKHVCPIGKAGMAVADTSSDSDEIQIIAFASNGTAYPDAFVILNLGDKEQRVELNVHGCQSTEFETIVTDDNRSYVQQKNSYLVDNKIDIMVTPRSAATLIAK